MTANKSGFIHLTIFNFVFVISGYLLNIFLGRFLGPEDYGIFGLVISLVMIINLIQTAGLPQALSKFLAENPNDSKQLLKSSFILQVITTVALTAGFYFLSGPISIFLNDQNLEPQLKLAAFIFPLYGMFSLYVGYYNGIHAFNKQALINIIYSIAKFFLVLLFTYFFGVTGAIVGFIFAPLMTFIIRSPLPNLAVKSFSYKKLLVYTFPIIGFAFFSTFQQSIDLFFVKRFLPSAQDPGFYSASQNIAKLPFFALSAFSVILFPNISKFSSLKLHHKSKDLIQQSMRLICLILLPMTVLIVTTSGSIIYILYSEVYLPAAPSLSILSIGFAFLTIFTILANILNGAGLVGKSLWISLLGLVITAIFCTLLIPNFGLIGAALSTSIGATSCVILSAYFVYKKFNTLMNPISFTKIFFASLTIYLISFLMPSSPVFLPITYLVLLVVYVIMLLILKEITIKDIEYINALLPEEFHISTKKPIL